MKNYKNNFSNSKSNLLHTASTKLKKKICAQALYEIIIVVVNMNKFLVLHDENSFTLWKLEITKIRKCY